MFVVSLPVFLEAKYILSLWLVEVPDYTVLFLRCVIAETLFRVMNQPIIRGCHATGNVKVLNLTSGVYGALSFLPMVYVLYKIGMPVWSLFVVRGFNAFVVTYLEMRALYLNVNFNRMDYIKTVYVQSISVSMLACILPCIVINTYDESFGRLCVTTTLCILSSIIVVYFLGINSAMRQKVKTYVKKKLKKG